MAGGQEQTPLKNNVSVLICARHKAGSPLALGGRLSWTGWGASPFCMLGTHRDTESKSQMPAANQTPQPVDHGHPVEPCTIFCELFSEQTEMSFPAEPKDLHPFRRSLGSPRTWWKGEVHGPLPVCPPRPHNPLSKDCWKLPTVTGQEIQNGPVARM